MKNALLRLREACSSLSAAEQQIARFIIENPEEATLLTVRQLAQHTFTSPSSVVRVCRSVGFDGYKELRRALVGELAALGDKGRHPEAELSPTDSVREIVDKVTRKNIQSCPTRSCCSPPRPWRNARTCWTGAGAFCCLGWALPCL